MFILLLQLCESDASANRNGVVVYRYSCATSVSVAQILHHIWEQPLHALHQLKLINLCLCECKWVLSLMLTSTQIKRGSFMVTFKTKSKKLHKKVILMSCIIFLHAFFDQTVQQG